MPQRREGGRSEREGGIVGTRSRGITAGTPHAAGSHASETIQQQGGLGGYRA